MNKEELLLINACKSYINDEPLQANNDIDWNRYYELARGHNLTGISHCAFQANGIKPLKEIEDKLFISFLDIVYIAEKQSFALNQLKEALEGCECPYILFKGAVLRNLYTVPESRSMGDIDMLIRETDEKKVENAFQSLGYSVIASNGAVKTYKLDAVEVEVHTKLSGDVNKDDFPDAFENSQFDGMTGVLENNYHLAYMIYHTAAHLKYSGAGIRLVLDIAFMLKENEIDLKRVFSILEPYKLTKFTEVILSICYQWFGYGELFTEDTQKVQEYLVIDGIFGSMLDGIRATVTRLREFGAFDEKQTSQSSPASLKLRLAFPSYETLRKAKYIKFLDGRPYLLPYAWGYRLIYNLRHKKGNIADKLKNIDDENILALAEEELAFFEEIGLK